MTGSYNVRDGGLLNGRGRTFRDLHERIIEIRSESAPPAASQCWPLWAPGRGRGKTGRGAPPAARSALAYSHPGIPRYSAGRVGHPISVCITSDTS